MKRGMFALVSAVLVIPSFAARPAAAGFGQTLIQAVQNDDQGSLAALLSKKVDVNALGDDGATPLAWAAVRCNIEIATLLLNAGANPNLTNEQGVGPLYIATTNGSPAMVKLLLQNGAEANVARESGETPLMAAARLGQIDVAKLLLEYHADANAHEKKFGQTALMWATGHPSVVRLLVEHGADI